MEEYNARVEDCAKEIRGLYNQIMDYIPPELIALARLSLDKKQELLEEAKEKGLISEKLNNMQFFVDLFDPIKKETKLLEGITNNYIIETLFSGNKG